MPPHFMSTHQVPKKARIFSAKPGCKKMQWRKLQDHSMQDESLFGGHGSMQAQSQLLTGVNKLGSSTPLQHRSTIIQDIHKRSSLINARLSRYETMGGLRLGTSHHQTAQPMEVHDNIVDATDTRANIPIHFNVRWQKEKDHLVKSMA